MIFTYLFPYFPSLWENFSFSHSYWHHSFHLHIPLLILDVIAQILSLVVRSGLGVTLWPRQKVHPRNPDGFSQEISMHPSLPIMVWINDSLSKESTNPKTGDGRSDHVPVATSFRIDETLRQRSTILDSTVRHLRGFSHFQKMGDIEPIVTRMEISWLSPVLR